MTLHQIGWLIVLAATLCMEAATAGLVTIWFSAGALAALITALLGAGIYLQIAVFLIVSALLLIFTKPIISKKLVVHKTRTNADRLVGEKGLVCQEINGIEGMGKVKISGKIWSAKSSDKSIITEGEIVTVEDISGVHLIVK